VLPAALALLLPPSSCCCSMWLSAPRPLSPQLLTYVVDDVRYLPALVMLMERDLLRVSQPRITCSLCQPCCCLSCPGTFFKVQHEEACSAQHPVCTCKQQADQPNT
jgi:hypothetical protein